jgi:hypothetical protein
MTGHIRRFVSTANRLIVAWYQSFSDPVLEPKDDGTSKLSKCPLYLEEVDDGRRLFRGSHR